MEEQTFLPNKEKDGVFSNFTSPKGNTYGIRMTNVFHKIVKFKVKDQFDHSLEFGSSSAFNNSGFNSSGFGNSGFTSPSLEDKSFEEKKKPDESKSFGNESFGNSGFGNSGR